MIVARRSVRRARPQRQAHAQSHELGSAGPEGATAGTWYDTGQTYTGGDPQRPFVRVRTRVPISRRAHWPRRLLITLGCLAAVTELAELGRLVTLAALAAWDPWYAAELAAIAVGAVTVCYLLYQDWQR